MDAQRTALEPVAGDAVAVGAVDEHALLAAAAHDVADHLRGVGGVEHQAVVAVVLRDVVADLQALGIHDRPGDMVAARAVADHPAVVGVHVVDRETQVRERVVLERVARADLDEDAVAAMADGVADHFGAGGVPDRNAVAGFGQAQVLAPGDDVVAHDRTCSAVQVDAEQVVDQVVVVDLGPRRRLPHQDRRVHRRQVEAGAGDLQAVHAHVRRRHGDHAAGARAGQHGAVVAGQRERPIEDDRTGMAPGRQANRIAWRGRVDHRLQRRARPHPVFGGRQRACRCPRDHRDQHAAHAACRRLRRSRIVTMRLQRAPPRHRTVPAPQGGQASTSIRPFISMCRAWQNHWQ